VEVRERIIGAISVMDDQDVSFVWELIQKHFPAPDIELVHIDSDELTPEEKEVVEAYRRGDEEYQPFMTHEDLKKELGL